MRKEVVLLAILGVIAMAVPAGSLSIAPLALLPAALIF